jgi:CDP-4-dehydro-6-deoxyglucose reductase
VYWGGRTPDDLYWDVSAVNTKHRYVPVLSRAAAAIDWTGARGHVQDALIADEIDLTQAVFYACGSDAMIHSARELLISKGLPERRFHSDAFVCSAVS